MTGDSVAQEENTASAPALAPVSADSAVESATRSASAAEAPLPSAVAASAPEPDAEATEAAESESQRKWRTTPSLTPKQIEALISAMISPSLVDAGFKSLVQFLITLCAHDANRREILVKLSQIALSIRNDAVLELGTLTNRATSRLQVQQAAAAEADAVAADAVPSAASASATEDAPAEEIVLDVREMPDCLAPFVRDDSVQHRLLRIARCVERLTTENVFDEQVKKAIAKQASSEGDEAMPLADQTPSQQQSLATSVAAGMLGLDSIWDALAQCLQVISPHDPLNNITGVLEKYIEAFFVAHQHVRPAPRVRKSVDNAAAASAATVTGDVAAAEDAPAAATSSDVDAAAAEAAPSLPSVMSEETLMTPLEAGSHVRPLNAQEEAFIKFVEVNRAILNDMIRRQPNLLLSGPFSVLVHYPQVLEFRIKENYFRQRLKRLGQTRSPRMHLRIRRDQIFESSYQQLQRYLGENMYGRIEVTFEGEEGVDAGGLLREWYYKLSHAMMNANYALFHQSNIGSETYMPNQNSQINPDHLRYFKFCGRIIAKAIFDHQLLDCHFTRAFYKQILGAPVSWRDIQAVDEPLYKSLLWILENDISGMEGDYTFSIDTDWFGKIHTVDLIPNGRDINVTNDNKKEYVRLVAHNKLFEAIREQVTHFKEGFHEVIPESEIAIFDDQELEMIISGLPEIDVEDLRANTEYGASYSVHSPQIQWFWRAVRSFDREERLKLIQFVTGTGKIPVGGFAELVGMSGPQKFSIHKDRHAADRLPQAHTCFNQLDLPEYESYDQLRQNLLLAINEGAEGFGFG
eukprot:m.104435 g.104435  ORF g.104435 m.104435 type:complete len:806 (-) comp9103_c4_seq1:114-2531(-)